MLGPLGMDADLISAQSSAAYAVTTGATVLVVAICVLAHYATFARIHALLPVLKIRERPKILLVITAVLAVHVVEIWVFGAVYFALLLVGGYGDLVAISPGGAFAPVSELQIADCVYFSAVTYTTVGYGEFVVTGALRVMSGTESLVGLVLIAWSPTFTFVQMSHTWSSHDSDADDSSSRRGSRRAIEHM